MSNDAEGQQIPTSVENGSTTTTNSRGASLDDIRLLLNETIGPIRDRLSNLENSSQPTEQMEDEHSYYSDSESIDSVESAEDNASQLQTSNSAASSYYILPREACVRQQVIELGDLSVPINGINSPLEVSFRNGKHMVRPLRQTPSVERLLEQCEIESDDTVTQNSRLFEFNAIKSPLHLALQPELGWNVDKQDKSIIAVSISQTL